MDAAKFHCAPYTCWGRNTCVCKSAEAKEKEEAEKAHRLKLWAQAIAEILQFTSKKKVE